MKWIFSLILFTVFLAHNMAQSIEQELISSSGGFSLDNRLAWSAGEVIIGGNEKLTQGFYQGNILITKVIDHNPESNLYFFPNPTRSSVHISGVSDQSRFDLYSSGGQCLDSGSLKEKNFSLSLQQYIPGTYFLKISEKGKIPRMLKIERFQ